MTAGKMNNKNPLRVLGILVILALVLSVAESISSNRNLSIEAVPSGPRVVEQTPIEGQRLELNPTIRIIFDKEMDAQKTEDSFSLLNADLKPVPVKITWENAHTFVFTPNAYLAPSTDYKAVFTTNASAKDGTSPTENIELTFTTIDALAVSQVFPAADTAEVDLTTSITVIFNHPVVPLNIQEEQNNLPQPIKLTPAAEGKGEWVNSSVYVFQPQKGLLSGTNYQVNVEAGLKDTNGNSLKESYSWGFNTRQPLIDYYALKNGEYNPNTEVKDVALDQAFVVAFQQPMDSKSVEAATKIINRETQEVFPMNFKWDDKFTAVTIEPTKKYNLAGFYELKMGSEAKAVDGGALREGVDLSFDTVPYPSITSVWPKPDSKNSAFESYIQIYFASPMDFESMKGRVQITPAIKGDSQLYYNSGDKSLSIYGLEPATNYVVRILPGMKDLYGNPIKDQYSYQFTNGDYAAYANLVLPWTPLVYRANGPQDFYFEHTNLDEGKVSVYPLSFNEMGALTSGNVANTDFKPSSNAIREWNLGTSSPRNLLQREHFLFDENGKKLEPGYYFAGVTGKPIEYKGNYYQGFIFLVASDNLTFKSSPTEALAWVTDLESGAPRKDVTVTFYNENFIELGKAKTDKDGLAYLKDIKQAQYALASSGSDFAFTASYWGSGIATGDLGIYENYYAGEKSLFGYLYTDRPVYRPDQEVFFKGIMRQDDDLHYSLPIEKKVYVVIDQYGEKIFADYVNVNEEGSFSSSVKLAENLSLGTYTISAYQTDSAQESPFASVSFSVAEYKKPEFEVAVTTDNANVLKGETVNFGLDSTYYSGGNVKGAQADWYMESTPYYFSPADKYSQYSFMDWDRDIYWSAQTDTSKDTIKEGQGTTDQNGHLDVSQTLDLGTNKVSRQINFYSNVTDVAGNTVSGSASVVVHQSLVYAGIRSESYVGTQDNPAPFNVVVLDWESNPVTDQEVTVNFVERQWFSVQKKDEQGKLSWETSVKDIPVSSKKVTTNQDGTAQVSFIPPKGGTYKAIVNVRDSKGNTNQASTYIWVASPEFISWGQTNDRSFKLIADKDSYSPGDTAELLIAQQFPGKNYALVTYERGHIYKQEVIQLEGSSTIYKLPITDELAPTAYVSVTVISGTGNGGGSPDFKIGMTKINIDTKQKTIDVNVTTDKKSAGPGDEVTYTIETKDVNGKPVSADASIAVVDKAALALAPANSPSLLSSFYPERGLSIMTSLGLISSADDFNENYRKSIADGSGSGGGGGGDLGVITVRENFKDTAIFKAQVTTDENGRAQVTVKLPENLTTWVADVRAVTADSRVGQTTNELVSSKPVFIQLQTPRFFVVGDQAQVGAIIHNNTGAPLKVKAALKAEGLQIKSEVQKEIEIQGKQQAYVTWDVAINNDAQRVDLTASATSTSASLSTGGDFTDASKPPLGTLSDHGIPVLNFVTQETVGTSGMITNANSATEGIQLPTSLNFTDAQLNIQMSPSLAASMQSGLTYLQDYEYLCIEQTVSRILPNVITVRALKLAGIDSPLQNDLGQQVSTALQRIYAKQKYDGGWNWWDGDQSDSQTTAYVVYGLVEAKDSGYPVSEMVLANGINYLKSNLPTLQRNDDSWEFNRYAFMLYVLARAGELKAAQTNLIFEYHSSLDLYGEAYLAQTLYTLDPKDSRISTLMSDLESATVLSAAGAHWEESTRDYWNWNTDTRTTAIVLNAFVQIDPKNPIIANAVRWLMAHRDSGHWYSTQETAWSLIALTNWLVASKEFETNYKYAIGLNSKLLEQGQANKDNLTDTVDLQVKLKGLLKNEVNNLVFTRGGGTGNLYYSAYLTATLPVEEVQPLDQGMTVSREYYTLDDPKHPITEIQRGDLVKVRLTIVLPASTYYIVINDPLPAGLEAIDTTLATDTAVPQKYTVQDYDERGWGWWYFTHAELRDEKVVLSADYLPSGTYVYNYIARASTKGTFKVIPPTASEFYFPDVAGRGAGSVFIVK